MKVINDYLLAYFRNRPCDFCGEPAPSDCHHVKPRGHGGGSRLDVALNLVSLCRSCHDGVDCREGQDRCWRLIEEREGLEEGAARGAVDRLLRRSK